MVHTLLNPTHRADAPANRTGGASEPNGRSHQRTEREEPPANRATSREPRDALSPLRPAAVRVRRPFLVARRLLRPPCSACAVPVRVRRPFLVARRLLRPPCSACPRRARVPRARVAPVRVRPLLPSSFLVSTSSVLVPSLRLCAFVLCFPPRSLSLPPPCSPGPRWLESVARFPAGCSVRWWLLPFGSLAPPVRFAGASALCVGFRSVCTISI